MKRLLGVNWGVSGKTSDAALLSNAGGQYHFVYAARRMLHMSHPHRNRQLIQMEGVADADMDIGFAPETFHTPIIEKDE